MQLNLVTGEDLKQLLACVQDLSSKIDEVRNLQIQNQILTNEKVVELLDVSPRTLQNYRDRGLIEFSQVGRKIYYTGQAVNHFLEQNKI